VVSRLTRQKKSRRRGAPFLAQRDVGLPPVIPVDASANLFLAYLALLRRMPVHRAVLFSKLAIMGVAQRVNRDPLCGCWRP